MSFGLVSTTITSPDRSNNKRRKIYWQFPQGAAQLMGLLSLLPNAEETDKPEFGWFERRFPTQRTTTGNSGSASSSPFMNGDGSALTDGGTGVTLTADTEYQVNVASTAEFKPTHVIEIRGVSNQTVANLEITGVVTVVVSATMLKFRPNSTYTGIKNTHAAPVNEGLSVAIKGTANREYGRAGRGFYFTPISPSNYTQIFRSAFNLSRTALKGGLLFDQSGPYNNMAKENGMRHMIEMEKAFLFGDKHVVPVADPDTGELTPETQTGGVIWFLLQYEAANSIYRGGTGVPAITLNTDPEKRIIDVAGSMTKTDFDKYMSRLFVVTQDVGYEKVALCGAGFLGALQAFYDRSRIIQTVLNEPTTKARFVIYSVESLYGTVHFKTHPLMTQDPYLTNNALFLDLGNLRFRPLSDSDTKFLKGRQETDRDGRKDEWITEAGLELKFPESCMYIKNFAAAA
jgi:Family of unknown function (DUF5309)